MNDCYIKNNTTLNIESKITLNSKQFQKIFYPNKKDFSIVSSYLFPCSGYSFSEKDTSCVGESLEINLAHKREMFGEEVWLTSIRSSILSDDFFHVDDGVEFHCSRDYDDILKDFSKDKEELLLQISIPNYLLNIVFPVNLYTFSPLEQGEPKEKV